MRRSTQPLQGAVIVDVGPELSDKGRAAIAGFVQVNQEFDDLEDFVPTCAGMIRIAAASISSAR